MTIRLITTFFLLVVSAAHGQDSAPDLASFFAHRLASDDPPPTYDSLLSVMDTIPTLEAKSIKDTLPAIWSALESKKENLSIEAIFALHEIAVRPDGSSLLRDGIQKIGVLLSSPDERLQAGSVETLKCLSLHDGDLTVPVFTKFLRSSVTPNLAKVEAVSALLRLRPNDQGVQNAVALFLREDMEADVQAHTLQVLAINRISSPSISEFITKSLSNGSDDIKLAAIPAARAVGPETWNAALPIVTGLATDPSQSPRVRSVAQRELENNPSPPARQ